MSDPLMTGMYGHRLGLFAKNVSSGSEIWVDRVQRAEPTQTYRTTPYWELGRVGIVGITQDPPEYRVVVEKNMTNLEFDFLVAGQVPRHDNSVAQQYDLGDLLGKNIQLNVMGRNDSDAIDKEVEISGCRISEIQFRFSVRDTIMETWTLDGTAGKFYTSGFPHAAWGALDNTSPGAIHGKEARIWFTSGSTAATRQFRVQSFNIRAAFPTEQVRELGRRTIVGTMSDSPEVTFDFDVLAADDQPLDKLFQSSGSGWDLNIPTAFFNAYIRVFDPDNTEGGSVLKMFKLENTRVVGSTPIRAQVRGLATMRYNMRVAKEVTTDSGGMLISNRNDL